MRIVSIDRFEGALAICEDQDGRFFALESAELPKGAVEGSVLRIDDQEGTLCIDEEETARRRSKNHKMEDKLFR